MFRYLFVFLFVFSFHFSNSAIADDATAKFPIKLKNNCSPYDYCSRRVADRWLFKKRRRKKNYINSALKLARYYDLQHDVSQEKSDKRRYGEFALDYYQKAMYKEGFVVDRKQASRIAEVNYGIGKYYSLNYGNSKNLSYVMDYLPKAAEAGYKKSYYFLGLAFFNGAGVNRNSHKAAKWFNASAREGNKRAMARLALLIALDFGFHRDEFYIKKSVREISDFTITELEKKIGKEVASPEISPYINSAKAFLYITGLEGHEKDFEKAGVLLKPVQSHDIDHVSEAAWRLVKLYEASKPKTSCERVTFGEGSNIPETDPLTAFKTQGAFRFNAPNERYIAGLALYFLKQCTLSINGSDRYRLQQFVHRVITGNLTPNLNSPPSVDDTLNMAQGLNVDMGRGVQDAKRTGCTPDASRIIQGVLSMFEQRQNCKENKDTVFMRTCSKRRSKRYCACFAGFARLVIYDIDDRPQSKISLSDILSRNPGLAFKIAGKCGG